MNGGRKASKRSALAGMAALVLGACVEPENETSSAGEPGVASGVADLVIDRGGQVALEAGVGVGVAVGYAEGGQWAVTAACDTRLSGAPCRFDLIISTDSTAPITSFTGRGLEALDEVVAADDFAVNALLETGEDVDGFDVTTSPGATVRVSALLYDPGFDSGFDWSEDPRFISWVGGGAVHRGAPTNPVDLTPDRP